MKINIYYGGRGIIEDPTLYVLNKIEAVLDELRVNVTRYNLYEEKNNITILPQTLKEADGIILACSVEWLGIGGYMQQFLDACWLYGDKEKISNLYMTPVIISTAYGEKEAHLHLINSWDLLGGLTAQGISAYVKDHIEFERNSAYLNYIEKCAENIYRTISQKIKPLPSSSLAIKQNLLNDSMNLTPQESEQLSKYVSDDIYVKQQKEDIEQLASFFKGKLNDSGINTPQEFTKEFTTSFTPQENFSATYMFIIEDVNKSLFIDIKQDELECRYEKNTDADVIAKLSHNTMSDIVGGRLTFQKAFMTGEMTAKGNFKTLRTLDLLFPFS